MNPAATELSLQTHINQLKKSSESLQPARYASLLQKCAEQKSAAAGKLVHQHILSSGCGVNRYLQNHLIFMYAKCGCLQDAVEVFELLPCPNVFSWTALITAYAKEGHLREVLGFFRKMQLDGTKPDAFVFSTVLTACSSAGALNEGKAIHDCVVLAGMETQVVGNAIVNLYGKCGRVHEAKAVFERLPERNLVSWNALIAANAQNGHCKDAMQVFQLMDLDGSVRPNDATFVSVVDACSNLLDLPRGKSTHERIIRTGFDSYLFVGNSLVNMYGKCGSVDHARLVFEKMRLRDVLSVYSWTVIIAAFAHNGHLLEAFVLFYKMDLEGVLPNKVTFVTVLRACTTLAQCEKIFARVKHLGLELDTTLGTAFVSTFAKLGDLAAARDVFENLGSSRNVVSWTVMIWAYAQQGFIRAAFDLYKRMDCEPNAVTFMAVMDSCLRPEDLPRAEQIHAHMVASGFESDVVLQVCLVTMYGKCGSVDSAWSIFENLKERSVVAWNSMLSAFASNGCYERSLKLYERMLLEGTKPDKITYLAVLDACQSVSEARRYAATFELELDIAARNAAVSAYARCGSLKEAKAAFDAIQWKNNAVTWNAMISGLAQHGESKQALECFWKMELEGVRANSVTYLASLEACSSLKDLTRGRQLHARILLENIHEANLSNAVINMYGKCGSLDEAMDEFVKMPERDVISWNTMIATYAQHGSGRQALEFFKQMDLEGWTPDRATYLGAIDACGSVPSLALGKTIHSIVATAAPCLEQDPGVATALVTMYARCGSLHDAKSVFWRSHSRNLVTWSNLIAACAQHGRENEALDLFREMQLQGTKPDALTFSTLVAACSRRGVVKDGGRRIFDALGRVYPVSASAEHYGCMVEVLGRAGKLEEAEGLIQGMPRKASGAIWMALLAACNRRGDLERGIRAANRAQQLDPGSFAASMAMLAELYGAAGRWEDAARVRKAVESRNARREPGGRSWIEVNNRVHEFGEDDDRLQGPRLDKIRGELQRLSSLAVEEGGICKDENARAHILGCCHSEKVAIGFGIVSTPAGQLIRIVKNLRACHDCHAFAKFVSRRIQREISVRDPYGLHCFHTNGSCSCEI
ncbi:hypothetical protein SELMODRAFT_93439 [Selaginella moellendorffii]|uniref:DYW domain-containing protein n=1 Tax=Selaginella moellendorffii TaxID=88036 RepID=D8RGU0_SELML|nr:hypothetical protein SELMODRAFT_93439 [Selaginella moellendorffii]